MAEPNGSAAGDVTAATGTGQAGGGDPLSGTGAATGGQASDAAGATPSGDDYEAKVRAGGDFAVTQTKEWQRRADQAIAKEKSLSEWMGPLEVYREQGISGDVLASHFGQYLKVLQDPGKRQAFERLLSGETRDMNQQTSTEDEYLTDEEREIRTLKQELESLKGEQARQHSVQGQEALTRHLSAVASEWNLDHEQVRELAGQLSKQVGEWGRQGEAGRNAIANLTSTNGRETVEVMMMKTLGRKGLFEHAERVLQGREGRREGMRTDGPSRRLPPNADPPEDLGSKGAESTRDVLKFIQDNPEILDRQGY